MMHPLSFPALDTGVARVRMDVERVDLGAPEARGRGGGVQVGWPLWSAIWELDAIDRRSADLWRAFITRLRGRQRLFMAGDPARALPRSAPFGFAGMLRAGGGAFPGSALTWAQAIDGDGNATITLTGLPAAFALSAGDYVGWKWDAAGAGAGSYGRRAMARVVVDATANGAGSASVLIEPVIDTRVVPAGAVAHLDTPMALFRQVPGDAATGLIGAGGAMSGSRLVAVQELWA